jgi:hypothetical protein
MTRTRPWDERLAVALREAQADHALLIEDDASTARSEFRRRFWDREALLADWLKHREDAPSTRTRIVLWILCYAIAAAATAGSLYWALAIVEALGYSGGPEVRRAEVEALCRHQERVFSGYGSEVDIFEECMRRGGVEVGP